MLIDIFLSQVVMQKALAPPALSRDGASLVARKPHNLEVSNSRNQRTEGWIAKAVARYALAITPSGIEKVSFK
jgi:hypothetical protein